MIICFWQNTSFKKYRETIDALIETIKETYNGTAIWRSSTAIHKQFLPIMGSFRRFITKQVRRYDLLTWHISHRIPIIIRKKILHTSSVFCSKDLEPKYNLCQKSLEHSFNKSTLHDNNKFPIYNEGLPSPLPLNNVELKGYIYVSYL